MTSAQAAPALITGDQLVEMMALIRDADSVELKLTIPEGAQRSAIQALRMDPLEAQIRQVFFFDTADLALQSAGVVVRARRVQRKGDDSTVKLRPVVPSDLPDDLRADAAFNVEVDAMPGGFVCSGRSRARRARAASSGTSTRARRSARSSPRRSARSTPSTRPRASRSTTCTCSGRSSSSS